MKSFYKPRYKICFQSKNKVYLNKNSKFRRYYNVRDPIFIRRYLNYRRTLVLRNMKWTVARRFMNPVLRKKTFSRYQYGTLLLNKQQLKHFYGSLKEKQFKKLFQSSLIKTKQYKEEAFLGALEHRLDILLFRMRVLPTIFACKQYILHQGIYVNEQLITLPHYQVKIGDIVSIKPEHWKLFYNRVKNKASIRYIGHELVNSGDRFRKNERHDVVNSLVKKYKKINLRLLHDLNILLNSNLHVKTLLYRNIIYNENLSNSFKIKILKTLKFFQKKFKTIMKIKPHLRIWNSRSYLTGELFLINNIILLKFIYKTYLNFINTLINNPNNNTVFLETQKEQYLNSLKSLEKYLTWSFRGYFLIPLLVEKRILKQVRKKHLQFQRRRPNVWWLDKNFSVEKQRRHSWWWESTPHWYVPNYLEIDYRTLRIGVIANPRMNEVYYPFKSSFNQLISFYTDKGH